MSSSLQVNKRPSQLGDKSASIPHTRVDDEAVIESMFSMGRKLGQGSFGVVREALDLSTGKKWAVKAVNKEKAGSSAVKLLEREVSILKRVNHDHIIHLEQVFETSKRMYLVMELCEHGELADILKTQKFFPEDDARKIIRDLASAISYLHKHDIVHRDLKLENILVHKNEGSNDLHIKVTDFGLSVVKDGVGHENMMQQFCGTPIYMPPEIVDNKTYSQQCDVWAMGVITYYLLSGMPPFRARDEETLYDYIKKGEINFQEEHIKDCTPAAHAVIQGMLKVDPAHRLTASEVLYHHWVTGVDTGTTAGNVLELMKQWKDELDLDDEQEDREMNGGLADQAENSEQLHTTNSSLVNSHNSKTDDNNSKSPAKTQKGKSKSVSASNRSLSMSSRYLYNNSYRSVGTNSNIRQASVLTATNTSPIAHTTSPSSAYAMSRRNAPHHASPLNHAADTLLEAPVIERETLSAGRRPTGSLTTTNNKTSNNRQKPEKSPPSQNLRTNSKKR